AAASTITTPLPSNPQQTGQPVIVAPLPQQGQAVTPVASAADLAPEAEKSVPAPQVSAPVTSQVSGQQQTAVAKPDRPIEPVLPTTPIKDSGEASTVSVQPEVQGAKSAISAAQTNQVLQQQAQQNTQQPIQSTPNVTPSVSATEQVVASEVAQGVDNSIVKQVPKVTAEAASVQGVESASVAPEESVAKTELASAAKEPAALAVSKASVDPAPVTAAAVVQTNRQQEATPEVRVAKQDAPQPVKPAGVGETTLSINAAPASVAPQAVSTNLQGQQSDALNMNLQQMRAGIDISAQAAAQEGEARETDVAKTAKTSAAETVQHLNSMQNSLRTTSPVQLQLPMGVPPGSQNWGRAVADKVMIAASQNLRVANIHLDPPELGALQVRLQVNGDQQVNISFTSPAGSVRDALEQQMPRLREMLEEQGINLGQSDVSDQQNSNGDGEQGDGSGGYAGNAEGEPEQAAMVQRNLSLVDYYA
ncbi:MAG: flagellar hook-length control protein FliK, partial [Pseudomonadales bacterium]